MFKILKLAVAGMRGGEDSRESRVEDRGAVEVQLLVTRHENFRTPSPENILEELAVWLKEAIDPADQQNASSQYAFQNMRTDPRAVYRTQKLDIGCELNILAEVSCVGGRNLGGKYLVTLFIKKNSPINWIISGSKVQKILK